MVAYGSVAHPVDLGPFSRIVEVHWSPAYLAVGIALTVTIEVGDPLPNLDTIGPALVEPFAFHYAKAIDFSAATIGTAYVGGSDHWTLIPHGDVAAVGLPDLSNIDLPAWQWTGEVGFGIQWPFHQWHSAAGIAGPYIKAPNNAGNFNQGLDPSLDLKGQAFLTGAPNWTPFFSNAGQWGTGDTATDGFPAISDVSSEAFSLAGFSATYKEKTWRPIASLVTAPTGLYLPGSLFVLMKREEVTA